MELTSTREIGIEIAQEILGNFHLLSPIQSQQFSLFENSENWSNTKEVEE